jgi:hypothetical protein
MNSLVYQPVLDQMALYGVPGNSFVTKVGERVDLTGNYINLIMASLDADLTGADIDGTFSIVDGENKTTYLDMNDTNGNYGNPDVNGFVSEYGGDAAVLATYAGGVLVVHEDSGSLKHANPQYLSAGDYIALYQNGMGVVLGLNGANNAIPRLPAPETAE